jgi:hypothetical protein
MPITLEDITIKSTDEIFGTAVYAVVNRGVFGFRVHAGIITGIRFTAGKPEFYVASAKESHWATEITTDRAEVLDMIEIPDLTKMGVGFAASARVEWPEKKSL